MPVPLMIYHILLPRIPAPSPSTVSDSLLFVYLLAFLSNSGHFPFSPFYRCSIHAPPKTLASLLSLPPPSRVAGRQVRLAQLQQHSFSFLVFFICPFQGAAEIYSWMPWVFLLSSFWLSSI